MQGYSARQVRPASKIDVRKRARAFAAAFIAGTAIMLAPGEMVARGVENMAVAQKLEDKEKAKEKAELDLNSEHLQLTTTIRYFFDVSGKFESGKDIAGKKYAEMLQVLDRSSIPKAFFDDPEVKAKLGEFRCKNVAELKEYMKKRGIEDAYTINLAYKLIATRAIDGLNIDDRSKDELLRIVDRDLNLAGYGLGEKYSLIDDSGEIANVVAVKNRMWSEDKKLQAMKNLVIISYLRLMKVADNLEGRPEGTGSPPITEYKAEEEVGRLIGSLHTIYSAILEKYRPDNLSDEHNLAGGVERVRPGESRFSPFSPPNLGLAMEPWIPVGGTYGLGENVRTDENGRTWSRAGDLVRAMESSTLSEITQAYGQNPIFKNPDGSTVPADANAIKDFMARHPELAKQQIGEARAQGASGGLTANQLNALESFADAIIAIRENVPRYNPNYAFSTIEFGWSKELGKFVMGMAFEYTTAVQFPPGGIKEEDLEKLKKGTSELMVYRGAIGGVLGYRSDEGWRFDAKIAVVASGTYNSEDLAVSGEIYTNIAKEFAGGSIVGLRNSLAVLNKATNISGGKLKPSILTFSTEPYAAYSFTREGVKLGGGFTYRVTEFNLEQMYGILLRNQKAALRHDFGAFAELVWEINKTVDLYLRPEFIQGVVDGKLLNETTVGGNIGLKFKLPENELGIGSITITFGGYGAVPHTR